MMMMMVMMMMMIGLTDARTLTASSDPTPSQASPHGGNEAGPGR